MKVSFYLFDFVPQMSDRLHSLFKQAFKVIKVILDIAAYFICFISESHVLLRCLNSLVDVGLMLLD